MQPEVNKDVFGNEVICGFRGPYAFLSNFYERRFYFQDVGFPSAEHAYVWSKTEIQSEREAILKIKKPGEVKRWGKDDGGNITLRQNWKPLLCVEYMTAIRQALYIQHPDILNMLKATKDALLIEGNWWHDNFWGDCIDCEKCKSIPGENNLGKINMKLRDEL